MTSALVKPARVEHLVEVAQRQLPARRPSIVDRRRSRRLLAPPTSWRRLLAGRLLGRRLLRGAFFAGFGRRRRRRVPARGRPWRPRTLASSAAIRSTTFGSSAARLGHLELLAGGLASRSGRAPARGTRRGTSSGSNSAVSDSTSASAICDLLGFDTSTSSSPCELVDGRPGRRPRRRRPSSTSSSRPSLGPDRRRVLLVAHHEAADGDLAGLLHRPRQQHVRLGVGAGAT